MRYFIVHMHRLLEPTAPASGRSTVKAGA
jgi:hypothetical protein